MLKDSVRSLRPALQGLQGFDRFVDAIHGLPQWLLRLEGEKGPSLETLAFADRVADLVKASAASLRDFSTTCNIVFRSRARLTKLPRFNVGEDRIEFGC